jgi:hypothetical protein
MIPFKRQEGTWNVVDGSGEKQPTFWWSIWLLVGHLLGTAFIFVTFFTIAWGLSALLTYYHGIHPFPEAIFKFVTRLEVGLVYVDAAFCSIVLVAGTWRYLKDLLR